MNEMEIVWQVNAMVGILALATAYLCYWIVKYHG